MPDLNPYRFYAVIVAGGRGLRMASEIRKQYIELSGIPILVHTLKVFYSFKKLQHIVLVVPEDDMDYCAGDIVQKYGFGEKVCLVSGGKDRQESVMNGLMKIRDILDRVYGQEQSHRGDLPVQTQLPRMDFREKAPLKGEGQGIVLIHDAVRPFVEHELISNVLSGAVKHGASVPVIPVVDTLKRGDGNGFIPHANGTVDREGLYQAQTPQAFDLKLILKAHKNALTNAFIGTDDASLVERMGKKIYMVLGAKKNIKITSREDLQYAEYLLSASV